MTLRKLIGLAAISGVVAWGIWQLTSDQPLLPQPALGVLLFLIGLIVGIRVGYESVRRFTADVTRMNRYIAEQNRDLVALNHRLLKALLPDGDAASESRQESNVES